jgi:chromate reductase, NAD(P)H dehydrogenase (quinone)
MSAPKILVLAAFTRADSLNRRLAQLATVELRVRGAAATYLDLTDYPLPVYNGDIEASEGVPTEAQALHEQLSTHAGVFIASPEYNAAIPPLLVNVLNWVSRVNDRGGQAAAFAQPVYALGAASPGAFGGYRGLTALRQMLELGLSARVLPTMATVPAAHEAFDISGSLRQPRSADLLAKVVAQLIIAASEG